MRLPRMLPLFFLILSGCATTTTKYSWSPAPEKTQEQVSADLVKCQRSSSWISPGRYGNNHIKFISRCMLSRGHSVEVTEVNN